MTKISFYCESCRLDQDLLAHPTGNQYGEWFISKCKQCKKDVRRYITDKHLDPYFRLSKKMKQHRIEMRADLLQPDEDGFRTLYKEEWNKIEKAKEETHLKEQQDRKNRDELWNQHKHDPIARKTLKRAFAHEEKLKHGTAK